jgi:Mce-associated membrane protein
VTTAISDETTGDGAVDETTATADTDGAPSAGGLDAEADGQDRAAVARPRRQGGRWVRILAYGLLPGLAFVLAGGAGYFKWQYDSARDAVATQTQSVAAAEESTIAMLSYQPDNAEKELTAARDRLTGSFRDSYSALIHDLVIPGAKQKHISAMATVPAAASVSATAGHAVVLVFVDQSITVGTDSPTSTASSVKVTLDKLGEQWLISDFTPV